MPLYDNIKLLGLIDEADTAIPNMLSKSMENQLYYGDEALSKQSALAFMIKSVVNLNQEKGIFGDIQDDQALYLKHKIAGHTNRVVLELRIITHPASQTVDSGASVTFTVVASGQFPLTYQWKKNGVNISGATSSSYSISSALELDEASYTVLISDMNGSTLLSNVATLTVNAGSVAISFGFFLEDPTVSITEDSIGALPNNISIASGANISMSIPQANADGYWIVTKEPVSEPIKTKYFNTAFNQGDIPDAAYQAAIVSAGFRYYVTRNQFSVDYTQPLLLKVL